MWPNMKMKFIPAEVPEEVKAEESEVDLEKLTVEELRKVAKEKGIDIKGLRKADLIEAIEEEEEEEEDED